MPSSGLAQETDSRSREKDAQVLFEEARQLMRKSQFEHACERFAESQRLDPALGTLLNLAACQEKIERLRSAMSTYETLAVAAREVSDSARQHIAETRLKELSQRVSTLRIEIPTRSPTLQFSVSLDGVEIPANSLNGPIPLDGGRHVVRVQQAEYLPYSQTFELANSNEHRVVAVYMARANSTQPATRGVSDSARKPSRNQITLEHTAGKPRQSSAIGFGELILGGMSVFALGIGTYYAYSAYSLNKRSNREGCSSSNECDRDALSLRNDALRAGNWATVSFVGAGVLGSAAIALHVFGHSNEATVVRIRASAGMQSGIEIERAF